MILATHKYLGLATGLIVLLVSLTGAAWVFHDEVRALADPVYDFPEATQAGLLPASQAKDLAEAVFPGRSIHGALYTEARQPIEVIFYEYDPLFYRSVFLHPTTGAVLHVDDKLTGFFAWVLRGHMYLWLPPEIGSPIVKYGILVFLLILVTGLLVWLPKRVRHLRRNLSLRWKPTTGWRRKNYDLHGIGGVYVWVFAALFAITGSVIGLPWAGLLVYRALGGEGDPSFVVPQNTSDAVGPVTDGAAPAYDRLIPRLMAEDPGASGYELHYPHDSSASVYVEIMRGEGTNYANDYRYFDQYELTELNSPSVYATYAEADFAKFVLRLNYDTHVGAIGGLPGKLLAFLASLVVASLPVTGVLIWWGRGRRSLRRPKIG